MNDRKGLTELQVEQILRTVGYNELPSAKPRSWLSFLLSAVREPMILLLLSCSTIYFLLGEPQDAAILLLSVLAVVAIAFYQEAKSGRALEALRDLTSPRARVIRDGHPKRIAGREVVPGDLLIVSEGDRIAADCRLLEASNLQTDESLLTGESAPVEKRVGPGPASENCLFASTLVTRGGGTATVTQTGPNTETGKIGKSLEQAPEAQTRLQTDMAKAVHVFGIVGAVFCVLVTGAYVLTYENWPRALLAGLAAAMALLPEEFPVILTVFLALGAWRLSKKNVLVRQPPATENLGAVTALCVDKTGTLTTNQMEVSQLRSLTERWDFAAHVSSRLPDVPQEVIEYAALASHIDPFDPMEKAIRRMQSKIRSDLRHGDSDESLAQEYPLSPRLMAMTRAWRNSSTAHFRIAAKGAPEAVLRLCRATSSQTAGALAQVNAMSASGLRVIAVAKAEFSGSTLPTSQDGFDFHLLGFIGLNDPVRPEVPAAIAECHSAGIRVIMMTGDYPGTAGHIARIAGLLLPERILTGDDIEKMNDLELHRNIQRTNVFARMVPNQKLRVVNALKSAGEVVAMTGDGVNDAPSLKWADVGIAMGQRGTDVAREAADLVLLDDCFTSIVTAIRIGRKIFENIQHAIGYVFAIHVPIAGMAVLPVIFGMPTALFPAHIVFMELIIDPTCSLIFESVPPDADTMQRPPRKIVERVFSQRDFFRSSIQGAAALVAIFGAYALSLHLGFSQEAARTLAFSTFVFSNLGLIVVNHPQVLRLTNRPFLLVAGIAIAALAATVYIPFFRSIFRFSVIGPVQWGSALAAAMTTAFVAYAVRGRPTPNLTAVQLGHKVSSQTDKTDETAHALIQQAVRERTDGISVANSSSEPDNFRKG